MDTPSQNSLFRCSLGRPLSALRSLPIYTMYPRPLSHAEALGPGCSGPALADPTAPPAARAPTALAPLSGAAPFAVAPADVAADADPRQRTT